jgi:hypothetical protein
VTASRSKNQHLQHNSVPTTLHVVHTLVVHTKLHDLNINIMMSVICATVNVTVIQDSEKVERNG